MIKLGCFGSVVAFNPNGDTCTACPVRAQCAALTFSKEAKVLELTERHETKRDTEKATLFKAERHDINDIPDAAFHKLKRFFARRLSQFQNRTKTKAAARVQREYDRMVENGIDFQAISISQNPFKEKGHYSYMYHAVATLIDDQFIKARDVTDRYARFGIGTNPNSRRTMANRALRVLELAGVVNKDEEGIFCQ